MKCTVGMRIYQNDRLVIRFQDGSKHYSQGKRVPKDCPIPRSVIRLYVKKGSTQAVKELINLTGMKLSEAWPFIRDWARYKKEA